MLGDVHNYLCVGIVCDKSTDVANIVTRYIHCHALYIRAYSLRVTSSMPRPHRNAESPKNKNDYNSQTK